MSRSSVYLAAALMLPGVALRPSEALGQVSVDPDGGTASKPENTPGNTVTFQVTNTGEGDNFTFSCSRTGAVTACTPPGNQFIDAGATAPVSVTFTTGSAGDGTVTLAAQGFLPGSWDSGWYDVTVTEPIPPDPQLMLPTGDVSVEFPTIKIGWCDNHSLNAGSRWIKVNGVVRTLSFDYNTADGPSCTARAASTTDTVALNLGSNSVEARICDNSGNCTAETYWITRRDAVAPTANLLSATTVYTEFPTIQLEWCDNESLNATTRWIKVNGVVRTDSFNYVTTGGTSCGAIRATSTTSSVPLVGGSNTVEAYICDNWSNCITPPRSFTITRNLAAPIVASWPYAPEKRDYSLCAVPGCFALIYAQSTVPYFSLDTPRNLTLVYNSDRVSPKPFVHVDVKRDPASADVPLKFQLQVKVNSAFVTFLNGEGGVNNPLNFQHINDGEYHRLGGQFDAAAHGLTTTGVYPMEIVVTAVYSGGVASTTVQTVLVLVNESNSALARGWTIAEAQRLITRGDSVLITEGGGNALYFRKSGSMFVSPAGEFSRVTGGPPWTRSYPDSTKVVFDNAGLMDYATDRFGNVTDFGYDPSNRLSSVTDPAGYTITLSYGTNGLQSITDHFGRVTNVTVQPQPDRSLIEIRDPDNVATTFGYDGSLRLISVTERRGFTTKFGYDPNSGQLASDSSPTVAIFGSPPAKLVNIYASWDKVGVPYGPTGTPVEPARWDTISGRVTDPGGHVTRFWSLNRYRQAHETDLPLSVRVSARYTSANQLRQLTQPIGTIDSIGYDASGLPEYVKLAGETASNVRYAGWAQPDSVWGAAQPRQRFWVGANGRVDSTEVGSAGSATRMRYKYDTRGRVTSVRDPLQHQTDSMVFGATNDNTWKVIRPGNRTTTYGYDIYGRVTSIAATGVAIRTIAYDLVNRVRAVHDGVNPDSTRYWYDVSFGSFTKDSVVDPKGQVYKFSYDEMGRLLNQQHPSGHVVSSYQYGWDSEVKRVTNARGQNIDFNYDALHRLVKRFGTNVQTDSLHYSADHRVITAIGPVTDWSYLNVRGVPDSVKTRRGGWDYWLRYAYTAAGLLDSVATSGVCCPPFLSRNYGYNTVRGTLDSIRLNGALTSFSLNNDLQPSAVTFPGGDQVSRGFTALHNEMLITSSATYNSTIERKTTLDTPGRLWRQLRDNLPNNQGLGHLYNYDGLGRLVTDTTAGKLETTPSCTGQDPLSGMQCSYDGTFWSYWWVMSRDSFAYDPVGNRLDRGGAYTNPGNRITAFDGCTYSTDADGNVTRRSCPGRTDSIVWDAANRPTRFLVNGLAYDLSYDVAGRPVRKDSAGVVQRYFLWDGDNLFAELRGVDGEKVAEYSYYPGLDNLHAVIMGSTPYYAHTDGVGNVVALTGADQSVYAEYSYDAWGANGAYFKGAQRLVPEVEFYYMRNRWYEPKTGRFLSEDPVGLEGGINPYVFAGNDPINGRDPTGQRCERVSGSYYVPDPDGLGGTVVGYSYWVCSDQGSGGSGSSSEGGSDWGSGIGDAGGGNASFRAAARQYHAMVTHAQTVLMAQCTAGVLLASGSAGAGVTEHTSIRGAEWRAANAKWYSTSWGGNQWTGGRNAVLAAGRRAQIAGRAVGGVAIGLSALQGGFYAAEGDYSTAAWHAADAVMAGVGTFGGPYGLSASLVYFVARHLTSCGG